MPLAYPNLVKISQLEWTSEDVDPRPHLTPTNHHGNLFSQVVVKYPKGMYRHDKYSIYRSLQYRKDI